MFNSRDSIDNLHKKIDTLQNTVETLHNKIERLETLLQDDIKPSCNKMGGHIDFVENVYENVQSPLGYIVGRVNYMLGGNTNHVKALPDITPNQSKSGS